MSGRMDRVMRLMAERQASDVFLSANMPVLIKIHGQMLQLSDQVLTPQQPRQLLAEVLSPQQMEELDDTGELNLAVGIDRVGSFRISAFKQRGSIAGVVRHIPHTIPALESLNVPSLLGQMVLEKRGLILMVGATGSGKSDHAGGDAGAAQPQLARAHPHHRRADRVPVSKQEMRGQPA